MNFKNLFKRNPKIKVGDTVRCIDDRDWGDPEYTNIQLQYGKTYKILDILIAGCCGTTCFDIGGRFTISHQLTHCGDCSIDIQGKGIHWADSKRFALHTGAEEEAKEETVDKEKLKKKLDKALASEDYEKATKLRDLINH